MEIEVKEGIRNRKTNLLRNNYNETYKRTIYITHMEIRNLKMG